MRIAFLSGVSIPSRSAESVAVMKMCQAMAGAGHEVSLVVRPGAAGGRDVYEEYGVEPSFSILKVPAARSKAVNKWLFPRRAAALVGRAVKPDLVYARHLPSLLLAARWRRPFVYEAHQAPLAVQKIPLRWLFRRSNFARLVVITRALADEYRRRFNGLASEKIVVAPDGADDPPAAAAGPEIARENHARRLRIGYVGHLYPGKGMEVITRLAPRLPEVEFHVVGGEEEDLRRWRTEAAGLTNVIFHGHVSPKQTHAFRQSMDLLIAPYQRRVHQAGGARDISRWMSPLKIFEYMASGKAIIASDLPVLREVLTDGVEAVLVDPQDLDAWTDAIRRLMDPDLRSRLGTQAAAAVAAKYTWAHRVATVLDQLNVN